MVPNPTCRFCGTVPNGGEIVCDSERDARQCPWMGESDWKRYRDTIDKARAWDAIMKARADEREACAEIALAIDSGRGNEREIAKAIRARSAQSPADRAPIENKGQNQP